MSSGETPAQVVERPPAGGAPVPATPVQVSPPSAPDLATLVMVVLGVVVVAALYLAREVLIPITLAILLSFVLGPVVSLFRRLHLPRVPAVLLAVVLALCIIATLGSIIGVQIASLAPELPRYASTVGEKINTVQSFAVGKLSQIAARVGERVGSKREGQSPNAGPAARSTEPGQNPPIPVEVHQPDPRPLEIAQRVLAPVLNPLETSLIVLIVSSFHPAAARRSP